MVVEKRAFTGSDTEGGITSGYAMNDGVKLKVPYSFFGAIFDKDEEEMVLKAMKQDSLTMGPQVQLFQQEFAKAHGAKHAFATTNCTTAMHVCTQVFDIKEGDEVLITANTFIASSLVIVKEKARPIFVDIDARTFNIDPAKIEEKVTPKTKAIYVVHYAGLMCDMDPIMAIAKKHNLYVLEDCAHAPIAEYKGRKAGTIGDVGCFSFHSLKNMTTCGEGGMITTNRDDFVDAIQKLRCMNLGQWLEGQTKWEMGSITIEKTDPIQYWLPSHFDAESVNGHWGNNYRMNEIQAACGRAQLRKLEKMTQRRIEIARRITKGIKDVKGLTPVCEPEGYRHVYHLYTLCVEEEELGAGRDELMTVLYKEEGIQGILHYQPHYHFTGYKKLGLGNQSCPVAEKFFYKRELNLPIHPRLTNKDVDIMIHGIRNAAEKVRNK